MKICDTCKVPKINDEFNKNKSKKDGLNSICRDCSRERSKKYYQEKGEKHKKEVIKRNRKNRNFLQSEILIYLKNHPCTDCGNNDIRVLEFDHLPKFEKKYDISRMIANSLSLKLVKEEIDKCEVVCANCHKIRTIERSEKNYRKLL